MNDQSFVLRAGSSPLIIGTPHAGMAIPDTIARGMTQGALAQPDTAHRVHELIAPIVPDSVTTISSVYCRYVIDLNRSPDGLNRFAGQNNTTLCTTERFDHAPIYMAGQEPDAAEVERRLDACWLPYHGALRNALDTARRKHGCAVLLDIHTIPPDVARFYSTKSPDLSLKSGGKTRAASELVDAIANALSEGAQYGVEVDGRFKGGYIVQHYGDPAQGFHSIQIEISQATYLDASGALDPLLAEPLRARLAATIDAILAWTARSDIRREMSA